MEQNQSQSMESSPLAPALPLNEYGRLDSGSYLKHIMHVYGVVLLIVQLFAMPGEVLLRRRFGERYLDPMMVFLGFAGLFFIGAGSTLAEGTTYSLLAFAIVYLVLAIIHRLAIFHRDLKGDTWHSQSSGIPYGILTLPARIAGRLISRVPPGSLGEGYRERLRVLVVEYVQIFVEPMLIGTAGFAMVRQGMELGMIFPVIGGAMLLKNILQYHMERTRVLDIVDSSIETEFRVDVMTGARGPEEAKGYKVSGVRLPADARRMFTKTYPANDDRERRHEAQG